MTKYILAGGNDRSVNDFSIRLKNELPNNLSKLKFVSCFFSSEPTEWTERSREWREWVSRELGITNYSWTDYDNFEEQISKADIVFFHGGNSNLLITTMLRYQNLSQKLNSKVVVGSSAGANMLSKNFWSPTFKYAGRGLGLLDVNIMVHYGANITNGIQRSKEDWDLEEKSFSEILTSENILHIPEGSIQVFNRT